MHIHKLHAGHARRSKHRARHSVGNIVEFQVEKNIRAELRYLAYCFRSRSGEELAADFEHAHKVRHLLGELQRRRKGIEIESDD